MVPGTGAAGVAGLKDGAGKGWIDGGGIRDGGGGVLGLALGG